MPALFIYLIKVNVALLIFCAGYYAVLRHLTFYNLNRVYLVTAIIFSTLYPRLNLADFINRHEEIAKPIQVVIINWQGPVKSIAKTFLGHDIWYWLQVAFWLGVCLFAIRLATQLLSLYRLHKRSEPAQLHHYMIRVIKGNINPFSFWRNIYINPENHEPQELNAILEHEHIHVSEWHTIDILLGEVSAIFYWFNPGVWLMKKAIRENIEFITDNKILQKGVDSKAYQYSLLNVNFGAQGNAIVNHFNISTIKKRIIMMNAKRSSNVNITRYLFLIPAVMCLLLVFSVSKAELTKAVKSSTHMIHVLKTAVNTITFTNNTVTAPAVAKTPTRNTGIVLKAVSNLNIAADNEAGSVPTIRSFKFFAVFDTTKKEKVTGFNIPVDTNKKIFNIKLNGHTDPDMYVNGVKIDHADLSTIDPETIASINVHKDLATAPNGAVYIITKDHDDKTASATINRIFMDTLVIKKVKGARITGDGKSTGMREVVVRGYATSSNTPKPTTLTVVSRAGTKGNVISNDTVYTSGAVNIAQSKPLQEVTVIGHGTNGGGGRMMISGRNLAVAPLVLDDLADKLIIIDGKEASQKQFNKLPAGNIQSISILKDESAKAIYGDKGKNGVVVITTKKKS